MADALLVLNAGSSSLKFSVFRIGDPPDLLLRGQLDRLMGRPRFVARDAAGASVGEHEWAGGTQLDHQGAIEFLFQWGQGAPPRTSHRGGRPPRRPRRLEVHVPGALSPRRS